MAPGPRTWRHSAVRLAGHAARPGRDKVATSVLGITHDAWDTPETATPPSQARASPAARPRLRRVGVTRFADHTSARSPPAATRGAPRQGGRARAANLPRGALPGNAPRRPGAVPRPEPALRGRRRPPEPSGKWGRTGRMRGVRPGGSGRAAPPPRDALPVCCWRKEKGKREELPPPSPAPPRSSRGDRATAPPRLPVAGPASSDPQLPVTPWWITMKF